MSRKHPLLLYTIMSRRMRGKLLWLLLLLLALGIFDLLVRPLFGDFWFMIWGAAGAVALLWFYYGVLVRRAAVVVKPEHILLQGPLRGVKISYGRIATVVSTRPSQHGQHETVRGRERSLLEPYLHVTCIFVELNSFPKRLQHGHRWFLRALFSSLLPGLVLIVPDWMALSRDLEQARAARRDKLHKTKQEDKRSLALRVLDY